MSNDYDMMLSAMLKLQTETISEDEDRLAELDRTINKWEKTLEEYNSYSCNPYVFTENMLMGTSG